MGESAEELRARLQTLLPAILAAEKDVERQRREHDALLDATVAAEAARESINAALQAPLCIAQAALNAALGEVADLDRKSLDEVKNLALPPKAVVRTLAIVHGILHGREPRSGPPEWRELKGMLARADFLPRVRGFRVQDSKLMDEAVCSRLRKDFEGSAAGTGVRGSSHGQADGPLTEAVVRRASKAVASFFAWANAQLDLAPVMRQSQASKASGAVAELSGQLEAAEHARARLAAAALTCNLKAAMDRADLSSPVAMIDAIHSADSGPQAIAALQTQLRGAEEFLTQLLERQDAQSLELAASREQLVTTQQESAELELLLEAASFVRGGPPLCDCGEEMVYREVCNLMDPNWGRKFWKCPRRQGGCEKREWDESAGKTQITNARVGG